MIELTIEEGRTTYVNPAHIISVVLYTDTCCIELTNSCLWADRADGIRIVEIMNGETL